MAKWIEWTESQKKMYAEWVASRPKVIRDVLEQNNLQMDNLYQLKFTRQNVILHSISSDGTFTVHVLEKYNQHLKHPLLPFEERSVFGILPSDLEETELPAGVLIESGTHLN